METSYGLIAGVFDGAHIHFATSLWNMNDDSRPLWWYVIGIRL
jgi:hypothetical protein